jgi:hypothetical protein
MKSIVVSAKPGTKPPMYRLGELRNAPLALARWKSSYPGSAYSYAVFGYSSVTRSEMWSSVWTRRFAICCGPERSRTVKRRFDTFVRNEQLHTGRAAFHGHRNTNDHRRHASGIECDLRQIGVDRCRITPDRFHDALPVVYPKVKSYAATPDSRN